MKKLKLFVAGAFVLGALASCKKEKVATENEEETQEIKTKDPVGFGYGGSLAQFTIVDDYLYTIDYKTLTIFHLADANNPTLTESIDMGIGMETVFHQNGRLFIGANNGVHIYDISDPRSPVEVSDFQHVTSCDPVIANDKFALATLRGGNECGGNLSQLDVIDITNIGSPTLAGSANLVNPFGLGFSNVDLDIVYVCDGYEGLKAFDVSFPFNPTLVMTEANLEAMDVIADGVDNLIVLTRTGVYQFDASNAVELTQKSFIPVQ